MTTSDCFSEKLHRDPSLALSVSTRGSSRLGLEMTLVRRSTAWHSWFSYPGVRLPTPATLSSSYHYSSFGLSFQASGERAKGMRGDREYPVLRAAWRHLNVPFAVRRFTNRAQRICQKAQPPHSPARQTLNWRKTGTSWKQV